MIADKFTFEQEDKFKVALEVANSVESNPKKDLLYSIAYELGHASGLYDIEYHYDMLVDLIK